MAAEPALMICPEAPYPIAGGGSLRTASLVEYLGRRYALDVIAFREPGAPDPRDAFPPGLVRSVSAIELPYHSRGFAARLWRNGVRYACGRPPLNDRFRGFGAEVREAIGSRRYALAVIEHFWCAPYSEQMAPRADRVVLDLHNIESALYARSAGAESWPVSAMFRRFGSSCRSMERRWLPRFDLVLAASAADAGRAAELGAGRRAHVYPNALPCMLQPAAAEKEMILFSGNMEYHPNVAAVRHFRERIWPLLRSRHPGLTWRLVGRNADAVSRYTRGDPRIEVRGAVENAVEAIAEARVVIVPLLAGSGTRLKILEAWAAGRAVVSTTLGAEGLDARSGEHLLIADGPESFGAAVSSLLDSTEQRGRLGASGRRLYEQRFTWPAAWAALSAAGI